MNVAHNNTVKEKILHATKNLFYEFGYEKTTARMIADRVSMYHSNIFYYFPNKRSILKLIIRNFFQEIRKQVLNLQIELSPVELLLFYVYILMKYLELDEKFKRLYYESTDVTIEVLYQDFIIQLYPLVDGKANSKGQEQQRKEYFMDLVVLLSSEKQLEFYRKNKLIAITEEEMRNYFTKLNLKLLDIDEETIETSFEKIDQYMNRFDFSTLNIFTDDVVISLMEEEK
ncbi:TetR/AcrR family transcriptional regulator [Alkalibacter rhizosphaerae]|uniref:TetR/AcrR family transcriptional regulator n=1 Tax=Alkalibacter rhizosphaerae TaxID=2815577 RepID=A0A974XGH2_9FIRM|nr:TetR/AcrR family transcriptional regulator [Alkalibacter rhizosphaerae]QSX09341.1 TetR/AcrR family transcriptional regulator [Alkalibacter rhizosphaerae]